MRKSTVHLKKKFKKWRILYTSVVLLYLRLKNKRWWPIPFSKNTDKVQSKVFFEKLTANHPSSHDGAMFGIRFHAVRQLILHGLWKKRNEISILYIGTEKAGPESGLWDLDSKYFLVWRNDLDQPS